MINNYNSYKKDFLLLVDNIWLVSDGSQTILVIKKKKIQYWPISALDPDLNTRDRFISDKTIPDPNADTIRTK